MPSNPEIFFHVGLGKVASTYLQHRFFPKLKNIRYIPTNRYRRCKKLISSLSDNRFLVSREFDRQLERELAWFTETFPSPHVIVIFRRHGSWIASQYRRYVKNGWYWDFDRFIDLDDDAGFWKKSDLLYRPKLEIIEKYTGRKPLVLFYDDLRENPWDFFEKIARFTASNFSKDQISLERVHTSYSEKQLLVLRRFCRRFEKGVPKSYNNKVLHWLLFRPWWAFYHLIMYIATLFPSAWVPTGPLIPPNKLVEIDDLYQADWEFVKSYAAENGQ